MKKTLVLALSAVLVLAFVGNCFADLNNGLVARYTFDKCDATDDSGNGNTGTIVGAPACVKGLKDNVLQFGGVYNRSYVSIPPSPSLAFLDNYTFTGWFNIQSNTSMDGWGRITEYGVHSIFAKAGDRNGLITRTVRDTTDGLMRLMTYNGGLNLGNGTSIMTVDGFGLNEWHQVTVTSGDGLVKVYFDGKLQGSMATDLFNVNPLMVSEPLQLGIDQDAWWYPINGMLDDFRVYNRAISESEVQDLYLGMIALPATIDVEPGTLNRKSKGQWVTAEIMLPQGYSAADIVISSVNLFRINGAALAQPLLAVGPSEIGDHTLNGIEDLEVKFDRQQLISLVSPGRTTLAVRGTLTDGTTFVGTAVITVIDR